MNVPWPLYSQYTESKQEGNLGVWHSFVSSPFPPFLSSSPSPRQRKSFFCCFFIVSRFRLSVLPDEFQTLASSALLLLLLLLLLAFSAADCLFPRRPAHDPTRLLYSHKPFDLSAKGLLAIVLFNHSIINLFYFSLGPVTAFF